MLTANAGLRVAALGLALSAVACSGPSTLPESASIGPDPRLPPAHPETIPTVKVAPAKGWAEGASPHAEAGRTVTRFAAGLVHPRWLYVLPNGDVLVAETNAPERPEENKGFKAHAMKFFMKRAGAGVPSADRITLLRDTDGDGIAETRSAFLEHVPSPFGMALVGSDLYVATADAVLRFPYAAGALRIDAAGTKVADLPGGPRNHHWTKNILASRDGRKLYATVGSNSNVAEHGMAVEEGRAAIWEIDLASGRKRILASGLRNPVGLGWEPSTGALWAVVNERDELGGDLVPDYLTSIRDGAFYGWPYSYYGANVDPRVDPPRPDLVARAVKPDYALGTHVAPLGLAFSERGAYVGRHGSWNRDPPSGYDVVFVRFEGGHPVGAPQVVLDGFLNAAGEAQGRPVGVALDARGGLLVADDVGDSVWRVR